MDKSTEKVIAVMLLEMERDYQKDIEVCEKATPEPWTWIENSFWGGYSGIVGKDDIEVLFPDHANDGDDGAAWFEEYPNEADREFITLARTALPWYIKRCMELKSQLQQVEVQFEQVEEQLVMALGEDIVEQAGANAKGVEVLRLRLQQAEEKIESKQGMLDSLYAKTERLWKWARETLNGEVAGQFWQISANGYLMHENQEYHQRINCLKHEIERLKALSSISQPSRYREMEAVVKAARKLVSEKDRGLLLSYNKSENTQKQLRLLDALTAYDKAGEGAGK